MYEEIEQFLRDSDMKGQYEMSFIDVLEDDLTDYENEKKILDMGYQLPITFIGGQPAFSGKVDKQEILQMLGTT